MGIRKTAIVVWPSGHSGSRTVHGCRRRDVVTERGVRPGRGLLSRSHDAGEHVERGDNHGELNARLAPVHYRRDSAY